MSDEAVAKENDSGFETKSGNGNLRTHKDFKKVEREIAELFGRDTTKGGRPSVGEREFREFYFKFANFKLFDELERYQSEKSNSADVNQNPGGNSRGTFFGSVKDATEKKLVDKISSLGPWFGAIFGLWLLEEEQIKKRASAGKPTIKIVYKQVEQIPTGYIDRDVQDEINAAHRAGKLYNPKTVAVKEQVFKNDYNPSFQIPEVVHTIIYALNGLAKFVELLNLLLVAIGDFLGHPLDEIVKKATGDAVIDLFTVKDKEGNPIKYKPNDALQQKKETGINKLARGDLSGIIDLILSGPALGRGF